MPILITDWIKVAQSGPTIDGREIHAQQLLDIAETYDLNVYTAVIWVDHERYYGSHGTVHDVKAESRKDGIVELYAKFCPGWRFLEKNKDGQKCFSSIETWDDFGKSGKTYLGGIAITDEPASFGTQEIKFFCDQRKTNQVQKSQIYCTDIALPNLFSSNTDQQTDATAGLEPAELKEAASLWGQLKGFFSKDSQAPAASSSAEASGNTEQEHDDMEAKQFKELKDKLDELNTKLDKFGTQEGDSGADSGQKPEGGDTASGSDKDDAGQYSAQFKELTDTMNGLATKLEGMEQRFNAEQPGTPAEENHGAADDMGEVY